MSYSSDKLPNSAMSAATADSHNKTPFRFGGMNFRPSLQTFDTR